jgi:hypothetical protein
MSTIEKQPTIILAGGRIRCSRCQALSRRSQEQCKKPALRGKRVCGFHGGKSTGPNTEAGKQRIAEAQTVHGRETRAIRAQRSADLGYIRTLEEAGLALGMFGEGKTRGRKPLALTPIRTAQEAARWLILDSVKGADK